MCIACEAGFLIDTFDIRINPVQDIFTFDGKVDCACSGDEIIL
jgi:hypothetical protein